jgi:Ni,Fe-hydrogenase III small subunit
MWKILKQIARTSIPHQALPAVTDEWHSEHAQLQQQILTTLGRALCIRVVDAGSCNACELEIQALGNPYYNIEGLGIKFVPSPRHADMLLVTGPVSKNMEAALKLAFDAMPDPKLVVAIGECACNGGIFGSSYASCGQVSNVIAVDLTVPGCPPPPQDILRGILSALMAQSKSSTVNI